MRTARFETIHPEKLLIDYVTLRTNRVEDFHAYIAGTAGRIDREYRADGAVHLELRHIRTGQFDIAVYFGNIDITAETTRPVSSPFLIQFPLRGHFVAQYPDRVLEIHPGQGMVISPTLHVRRTSKPGCTIVFSVPSALVYARAEMRAGHAIEDCLIFEPEIAPSQAEPLLEFALTFVEAFDRGMARPGDALSTTFENGFVDLLLELQPLRTGPKLSNNEVRVRLDRIRVVTDYVDSHLDEVYTVAHLAEVAGCTVRALQSTFSELCRTSVLGHVKQRRLAAARRRMESGDSSDSIAAVALACGFPQLGRFSAEYREHFGEKPSETVARAGQRTIQTSCEPVIPEGNDTETRGA